MVDQKDKESPKSEKELLPVSLLCGFLGAGKTTLLKHVLETKHEEKDFRCAVIVNDMAALNIDKTLIDQSALVQSDEVIAMQNGCFCCTLQSDLVDQIIELTEKKIFNYMLIEASGVSEPSQIAPLFDLCDDEHDPNDPDADHDHEGKPQLGEVARLDTCVTVVDSAEFYNNLGSMKTYEQGDTKGTIAELMMEQVEFSNVVILNKGDLVSQDQTADIIEKITLLNSKAKIVKSVQSKVNVKEILNTHLYEVYKDKEEFWMTATKVAEEEKIQTQVLECCEKTLANEGKKCCKSKSKNMVDSGLSQVQLDVAQGLGKDRKMTRHEARFGITSFIYYSRRPFHPGRLGDLFLEPYFCDMPWLDDEDEDEDEDEEGEEKEKSEEEKKEEEEKKKKAEEEKEIRLKAVQKQASEKQVKRSGTMGELLRSKGFLWIATTNKVIGGWQQAGNVIRLEAESPWMCEIPEIWQNTPSEALIVKDMKNACGKEYKYADRRQEIVFIGQNMKHEVIQKILDECLLNDEEMALGPEKWEETMADVDKIQLALEGDDDDEEEEEDFDEENGEEGEEEKKDEVSEESEAVPAKRMKKSN